MSRHVETTLHLLPEDTATFVTPHLDTDRVDVKNETGDALLVTVLVHKGVGMDEVVVTVRRAG